MNSVTLVGLCLNLLIGPCLHVKIGLCRHLESDHVPVTLSLSAFFERGPLSHLLHFFSSGFRPFFCAPLSFSPSLPSSAAKLLPDWPRFGASNWTTFRFLVVSQVFYYKSSRLRRGDVRFFFRRGGSCLNNYWKTLPAKERTGSRGVKANTVCFHVPPPLCSLFTLSLFLPKYANVRLVGCEPY